MMKLVAHLLYMGVGIVTRLQAGHVKIHGSVPGRGNSMQTGCGVHPASYPVDNRGLFSKGNAVRT